MLYPITLNSNTLTGVFPNSVDEIEELNNQYPTLHRWEGREYPKHINKDQFWARTVEYTKDRLKDHIRAHTFYSLMRLGVKGVDPFGLDTIVSVLMFDADNKTVDEITNNPFFSKFAYYVKPSFSCTIENPTQWHVLVPLKTPVSKVQAEQILATLLYLDIDTDTARCDALPSIFGAPFRGINPIDNLDASWFSFENDFIDYLTRIPFDDLISRQDKRTGVLTSIEKRILKVFGHIDEDDSKGGTKNLDTEARIFEHCLKDLPLEAVFNRHEHGFERSSSDTVIQWNGDNPWGYSKSGKSFTVYIRHTAKGEPYYWWINRSDNMAGGIVAYHLNCNYGSSSAHKTTTRQEYKNLIKKVFPAADKAFWAEKNGNKVQSDSIPSDSITNNGSRNGAAVTEIIPTEVVPVSSQNVAVVPDSSQVVITQKEREKLDAKQMLGSIGVAKQNGQTVQNVIDKKYVIVGDITPELNKYNGIRDIQSPGKLLAVKNTLLLNFVNDTLFRVSRDGKAFIYWNALQSVWKYESLDSKLKGVVLNYIDRLLGEGLFSLGNKNDKNKFAQELVCTLKAIDASDVILHKELKVSIDDLVYDYLPFSSDIYVFKNGVFCFKDAVFYPFDAVDFPCARFIFYTKSKHDFNPSPDTSSIGLFKAIFESLADDKYLKETPLTAQHYSDIVFKWLQLAVRKNDAGSQFMLFFFGRGGSGKTSVAKLLGNIVSNMVFGGMDLTQGRFLGSKIDPNSGIIVIDEFNPSKNPAAIESLKRLTTGAGQDTKTKLEEKYGGFRVDKEPKYFVLTSEEPHPRLLNVSDGGTLRRMFFLPVEPRPETISLISQFSYLEIPGADQSVCDRNISNLLSSICLTAVEEPSALIEAMKQYKRFYGEIIENRLRVNKDALTTFIVENITFQVINDHKEDIINSHDMGIGMPQLYYLFSEFTARYFSKESSYWDYQAFYRGFRLTYPRLYNATMRTDYTEDFLMRQANTTFVSSYILGIKEMKGFAH